MGIQGLLPLLKDVQRPVHVASYAGQTLGVDAYVWLHRGAYGCAREIVLGDPTPRYIAHALSRIRMLQHFGVKPYLVFDGDKLPAKRGTEDEREQRRSEHLERARALEREGKMQQARDVYSKCVDVTPEMAYQLIKALRQHAIPYVVAPYEADAQLAYLEAERIIDGIITEDSDLLVFGCKTVLFKLDQAGNAVEMLQHRFWSNRELALAGWTAVEFRQMAILSGCDYLPSIVGMGLKNAHRLLRRYKTVDKVLQAVRLEGKLRVPAEYAREFRKAELTFVHQRVYDPRTQRLVTLTPLPEGTHDDMLPFIGAAIDDDVAIAIAEGVVDPITRTPIVDRVPKPLTGRSSSVNDAAGPSSRPLGSGADAASPAHGLQRSSTAPTAMQGAREGGAGVSSFYRTSVGAGAMAARKKVVSKEAGLQSLKNFFVGAGSAAKESAQVKAGDQRRDKVQVKSRTPLAPLDTNRASDAAAQSRPTQSKFFARAAAEPKSPVPTQRARSDHAYLHLGGELTPPRAAHDPNDSGYWDDECHDMHDFVRSSSPAQPQPAASAGGPRESQPLVVDTQELMHDEPVAPAGGRVESVVATQITESTASSSVPPAAAVVVPQTPSRRTANGAKRRRTESAQGEEVVAALSSPESVMGSGFISSPASSSVQGDAAEEGTQSLRLAGLEQDPETLPSSPLLSCVAVQSRSMLRSREEKDDDDDEVQAEPVTPLARRGAAPLRKPLLQTSASMSKLEAFRYAARTPQTVLRRSTDVTPASASRPSKALKRSPTLLLEEEGGEPKGLFDRFRFKEAAESHTAHTAHRQIPF